jgi:hypothetical protein
MVGIWTLLMRWWSLQCIDRCLWSKTQISWAKKLIFYPIIWFEFQFRTLGFVSKKLPTNNKLFQVVKYLVPLSMWSGVQFLAHVCEKIWYQYHSSPKKKVRSWQIYTPSLNIKPYHAFIIIIIIIWNIPLIIPAILS